MDRVRMYLPRCILVRDTALVTQLGELPSVAEIRFGFSLPTNLFSGPLFAVEFENQPLPPKYVLGKEIDEIDQFRVYPALPHEGMLFTTFYSPATVSREALLAAFSSHPGTRGIYEGYYPHSSTERSEGSVIILEGSFSAFDGIEREIKRLLPEIYPISVLETSLLDL